MAGAAAPKYRLLAAAMLPALLLASGARAQGFNPFAPPAPVPQQSYPQQSYPQPAYPQPAPQAQYPQNPQGQPDQQTPGYNPVCAQLQGQLVAIDHGGGDPGRAAQVKRFEDNVNRLQASLDNLVAQQRRLGCQSGFFSIFANQPAQCTPLNAQIDQTRTNLDRAMGDLQQVQANSQGAQDSQRQNVIAALAQNNCGPQYGAAQRGVIDNGFGGNPMYGGVDVSQGGTYRTLCVRTCDGYYYPISFATTAARFADDERTCHATCPNAETVLYVHPTNGDVRQAVSLAGQPYAQLPNAFRYRQQLDPACSCRKAGQSWADALAGAKDLNTATGDIVVTGDKARALSQPAPAPRSAAQPPRQ